MKKTTFLFLAAVLSIVALAQPSRPQVQVVVAPEGRVGASLSSLADAFFFKKGEKVAFQIQVLASGVPLDVKSATVTLCEDKMPAFKTEEVELHHGSGKTAAVTMKKSGFMRCDVKVNVEGKSFSGSSTVGFGVDQLQPVVQMPSDFKSWWDEQLAEAAKVPMDARLKLLDDKCTEKVNVYEVAVQAVSKGCRVYGILAVPKAEGCYPAVMRVPGAGIHQIGGMIAEAEKGFITLDLGIHGIPLTQDASIYSALSTGALNDYPSIEITSRSKYYYRRVFLSAVRAAEYLTTLPQYDGKNLFVCGGSQGGALSIVTAALCNKVTAIEAFFPAMADQEAYLAGRAGGWPHYFYFHKNDKNIREVADVIAYYDVVNFARINAVPTFLSFGLADLTCAPTSTYSVWNALTVADKCLVVTPETGHWRFPTTWQQGWDWMMQHKK